MITDIKNLAPNEDKIQIYTDEDETITIERDEAGSVFVSVVCNPSDGSGYEHRSILGQEGETTKL